MEEARLIRSYDSLAYDIQSLVTVMLPYPDLRLDRGGGGPMITSGCKTDVKLSYHNLYTKTVSE